MELDVRVRIIKLLERCSSIHLELWKYGEAQTKE